MDYSNVLYLEQEASRVGTAHQWADGIFKCRWAMPTLRDLSRKCCKYSYDTGLWLSRMVFGSGVFDESCGVKVIQRLPTPLSAPEEPSQNSS